MDAITSQRMSGMLARSFSSLRSDHAAEGERASRGQGVGKRDCDAPRCDKPKDAATEAESAASLSYRRAEGTSLFIKTQEGDTVKLTISSRTSLSLAASQTQDGDQSVSTVSRQASAGARVSFEVEGDLNAEEMAAISGVMEQAGALAQQFFDNDVGGAFDAAANLKIDASQLATVGLRMSLREQMTYSAKGPSLAHPTPLPRDTTPAATTTTATPAANATTAATTPVTPPAATPTVETKPTESVPETTAPPTPTADAAPAASAQSASDVIRRFLTQLMDTLSAPAGGSLSSASLDMSLKLRIFQSVVTSTAETKAAETGTEPTLSPLVPETLDALAARQEPPLKAVA